MGLFSIVTYYGRSRMQKVVFIINKISDIEGEMDMWTKEFLKYFIVDKVTTYKEDKSKINN